MMKKHWTLLFLLVFLAAVSGGCASEKKNLQSRLPVKVLILPKFEVGNMEGDFPGEAQYYYEGYLSGGKEYALKGAGDGTKLYYKNGVAMCVTGMGKVSAALHTAAALSDERFDFSKAYILSTGCAGSAEGYGVMGDVYILSAAVDYDLGHHADPREMSEERATTWFHDDSYDEYAVIETDPTLTAKVYDLVKDIRLETTERTAEYMRIAFPGEAWADREPRVLRGTAVSGDNFWKGRYDHQNVLLMMKTYGCTDPYAVTEMEEIAVGRAVKNFGLLDRLIILRDSVNTDVFMQGATPESLWEQMADDELASEESVESLDIFPVARRNNYAVGKTIIDAILAGSLESVPDSSVNAAGE